MLLLLLVTIGVLTFANIRSVISANGVRESERIERIGSLLNHSRFPLTANVLGDMSSLSGAEFLLVDQAGSTLASTPNAPAHPPSVSASADVNRQAASPQPIVVNGKSYYHTRIKTIQQQNRLTPPGYVHVFVDRPSEFAIWKQASRMPLLIALVILTIALLLSLAFASQVTRPLTRLRHQVLKIAEGDMTQIPPPEKNDEIQDLGQAVNEMAAKLQDHDLRLRQNERLRTMVQFGSGVAHHLRNSATGCQMAIQLMAKEFDPIATSDNYEVAIRQLNLMNSYIKKFLLVSKASSPNSTAPPQRVDLHKTFTNVIFLLRPSARHLLVELADVSNCEGIYLEMQEED
ncbi:MAG: signal transduction histidine kinase, partial [Mariniblastus sp.]